MLNYFCIRLKLILTRPNNFLMVLMMANSRLISKRYILNRSNVLKAILSKNDTAFPRTHDLEDIIELCRKNDIELIDNVDRLTDLTEYAVQGRYAIIHDDLEDADEYIILLEKLLSYAKQQIL